MTDAAMATASASIVGGLIFSWAMSRLKQSDRVMEYYVRVITAQDNTSRLRKKLRLPWTMPEDVRRGIRAAFTFGILFGLLFVALGISAFVANL